jgi:hypothetical protein
MLKRKFLSVKQNEVQDLSTQRVLNNTFEVTTCAKTFDGTILGCISKEPPTTLPTLDCHLQRQLELPTPSIEMNTVVSSDGVVPLKDHRGS